MEFNRKAQLLLLEENNPLIHEMYDDFDTFAEQLGKEFREIDSARRYEQRLMALRQTTSAASYATAFREIRAKTKLNEEAAMLLF